MLIHNFLRRDFGGRLFAVESLLGKLSVIIINVENCCSVWLICK